MQERANATAATMAEEAEEEEAGACFNIREVIDYLSEYSPRQVEPIARSFVGIEDDGRGGRGGSWCFNTREVIDHISAGRQHGEGGSR